jgi:hypothetical protein
MRNVIRLPGSVALSLLLFASGACFAESPPDSLRACAAVRSDQARLMCYDAEMAAMGVQRPANTIADVKPGSPDTKSPEIKQPVSPDTIAPLKRRVQPDEPEGPKSFGARVKSVSQTPGKGLRVELDNGQVWTETEARRTSFLNAGDAVTIKSGWLGSWFLTTPSGMSLRVTRVE